MTATALINSFGQTVSVTRYGSGSYVNGTYVSGATSVLSVKMSIQPLTGRELLNLPEGQRTRNFVKGYCAEQLYTAQQATSNKADIVTVGLIDYEVQNVEHWQDQGSNIDPFWKVLMAEVNPS